MNREQIIRDTAYAIWEAEGRPDGRANEHWRMAEANVVVSTGVPERPARPTPKPAADAAPAAPAGKPSAKPPAKASAASAGATDRKPAAPRARKPKV